MDVYIYWIPRYISERTLFFFLVTSVTSICMQRSGHMDRLVTSVRQCTWFTVVLEEPKDWNDCWVDDDETCFVIDDDIMLEDIWLDEICDVMLFAGSWLAEICDVMLFAGSWLAEICDVMPFAGSWLACICCELWLDEIFEKVRLLPDFWKKKIWWLYLCIINIILYIFISSLL